MSAISKRKQRMEIKTMEIKNLTPHAINVFSCEKKLIESFAPTGEVARVKVEQSLAGDIGGIPIYKATYGDIVGLPEPKEGVIYIVSGMVAAACPRHDVFSPGELLRDDNGKPIGCVGLKSSI